MFDIGWAELLLIAIVALIVVGPKDLPAMFKTVGQYMGRARGMAREFQRSMEQAADESGLKEAANSLRTVDRLNPRSATSSVRKFAEKTVGDPFGGADPFADADPAKPGPSGDAAKPADAGSSAPDPQPQPVSSRPASTESASEPAPPQPASPEASSAGPSSPGAADSGGGAKAAP